MKKIPALFFMLTLSATVFAQFKPDARSRPLALQNVSVIDMTGVPLKKDMTVVIRGSRIAAIGAIGAAAAVKIPKDAFIVDARGKYLIPGLWDMHVHLFNNVGAPGTDNKDTYFPLFIANGVTGVRDMFTDADDIRLVRQWQAESEAGKLLAPRIIPASSIIDGIPVTQKNSVGVAGTEDARRAVRTFKAAGAGFIKVYENLSRESFFAIADEAKKLNIPFAGHVPETVSAVEASTAGQKSIEHQTGMLIACSSAEDKFRKLQRNAWTLALRAELLSTYSEEKCRRVSAVLVRNGTWADPTFVQKRSDILGDDERFRKDARLVYVSAKERENWLKYAENFKPATRKNREARFQGELTVLRLMHRVGVLMLAGTDVGNPFIYAGFSLHDELENFIEAGLTPFEALRTATVNPAKYLGMESRFGTVEKGKSADLVLLDADPLEEIGNTRKIAAVILGGKYLSKEELRQMTAAVEKRFK